MFQGKCVIDESHVQIVDANVSTTFLRQHEVMSRMKEYLMFIGLDEK